MKYPNKLIESRTHGTRSNSVLIKTIKTSKPELPNPEVPKLNCSTSRNWRGLNVSKDETHSIYYDQRYAVEIKGIVYNADHSKSIVAEEFEVGDYTINIPLTSEGYLNIYIGDNDDTSPVMVRLIPSPDTEYNRIYGVDEDGGESLYTNKDSAIYFCMTPKPMPRKLSCTGATSTLKLKFANQTYNSDYMPVAPASMWYSFILDEVYYFDHNFAESAIYVPADRIAITGHYDESDNSLNISVSSDKGAGRDCRLVMKDNVDYVNSSYLTIDESSNPTCFRSDDTGDIHVCLLTTEAQISCDGATDQLAFSVKERSDESSYNHSTLVYNISVDGVDYGEHNLAGNEVQLGHMTLNSYVSSDGDGTIYASTRNGGEPPARFVFTPRTDMVDANFWGVDEESNPTVVYDAESRSVRVCLSFMGNT